MRDKIFATFVVIAFIAITFFIVQQSKESKSEGASIVVTNFVLYDFTKAIAKDRLSVKKLIPFGVESHSFDPTPKDIVDIIKSKLFIYNGAGFEEWIEKIVSSLPNREMAFDMSSVVKLSSLENKSYDPHYWFGLENSQKIAKTIYEQLVKLDNSSQSFYLANLNQLLLELEQLDRAYKDSFKECKHNTIVVLHSGFSYLANSYDFKTITLKGVFEESEPTPKDITNLIEFIKENNLKYIFDESYINSKEILTISKELNIEVLELNPLENISKADLDFNHNYISLSYKNLENLKKALECH